MNTPGKRPTVLVLGVGGNVSQGIQKALAVGPTPWRVVAACVSAKSAGLYVAERALISPLADAPEFVEWVIETAAREQAVAILSGTEPVLSALAPHAEHIRACSEAVVVVSPPEVLAIGADKLVTARWLEQNGLPAPRSVSADDAGGLATLIEGCGWPLIAKPRAGKGGVGVSLLASPDDLACIDRPSEMVVQEHLGDAGNEFTIGCVSDRDGVLRAAMVLRRELGHGTTMRAEAGRFPEVLAAASEVVSQLRSVGPCNVQMRLRADGTPVAFELNVRFSGTTPIRARMGFAEVDAVIRNLAFGEAIADLTAPDEGVVVRYHNEIYMSSDAVAAMDRGAAAGCAGQVETWGMGG